MKLTVFFFMAAFLLQCQSTVENKNPVGVKFPPVNGTSLDGKNFSLPEDISGRPAVLLIGYKHKSQFDIDRWILGLLQTQADVPVYELPTLKGLAPRLVSSSIDNSMRDGIPKEDWGIVITVYKDAEKIINLLGNEKPKNARVVLLNPEGKIIWAYDRGYSAGKVLELSQKVKALQKNVALN